MSAFFGTLYDHADCSLSKDGQDGISVTAQSRVGSVQATLFGDEEDPTVTITVDESSTAGPNRQLLSCKLRLLLEARALGIDFRTRRQP